MFDLNDITMENIIFAMEDQAHSIVIDPETGQAVKIEDVLDEGGGMVSPPMWTSGDGFNLMESFLLQVRNPNARRELSAALGRGKGVFRAFKEALAAYPEIGNAFREYKVQTMRRMIREWYDELREANGLERLGVEPEETTELLWSDLAFRTGSPESMLESMRTMLAAAEGESCDDIPGRVAELEIVRLRQEVESGREGLCAVSDDDAEGVLACALGFIRRSGTRTFGSVEFIHVRQGFRRIGLGSAVLDMLVEAFYREGISLVVVNSPLVPAEFASSLTARGFRNFGMRAIAPRV